ncbi:tubulin-specific chaperone C [Gadus macrocephalus]|uniref:tubulin-specific chaperone C n=1 Tax=Gadus macrocephalus TaxID=80720 RepID=UPI0028CB91A2|nr:tubulin-specific chaperone C [Gadus macrocephalus]
MDVDKSEGNRDDISSNVVKIPERMLLREQARLDEVERRKEAKESHSVADENSEFFTKAFNRDRAAIEDLISICSGADRASATQTLDAATAKTQQLQKFLNDSMMFLAQYELRQAQAALQKLQTSLAEKRDEALPKKKFAFRSRTKATEQVDDTVPATLAGETVIDGQTPAASDIGKVEETVQCGFSNMDDVVLTKTAGEINKNDVLLSQLTNCKVRLFGSPSTLHIKNVSGCEILCGPVSGSVFVDHCSNTTLVLPCQQLRTHNTTSTQVYLHVTSRAIIEDCHGVSFAPFTWSYPTLDEDYVVSGLDLARNNWSQVDDFNWLAATQSPNWTLIPEEDRKTTWET